MILMPSNNTGYVVKKIFKKYPDKIALMLNPGCIRPCQMGFKYAIDNAAFKKFDEKQFFKLLDFSRRYKPPLFVVCPDVVGCHDRTFALWRYYSPMIRRYGYKIAFVAQNGCEPELVPHESDFIFIGGTDPWKMDNIEKFMNCGKPVHVGRVNSLSRLKYCESLGVHSVDGTGWMRARDQKFYDMLNWFKGISEQHELF